MFNEVASIKVIGIGKSGSRAIDFMQEADRAEQRHGIEYAAICMDASDSASAGSDRIPTIDDLFGGAPVEDDFEANEETWERVRQLIGNADMVILVLALGCRASAEAARIVAQAGREAGVLTVVAASRPLPFEGRKRTDEADRGLAALLAVADSVLVFSPEHLAAPTDAGPCSLADLQQRIAGTFHAFVRGITDCLIIPGLICTDFADVKFLLSRGGLLYFGKGTGRGDNRAVDAVMMAMNSPLFEGNPRKARSIFLTLLGGPDMNLSEVNAACTALTRMVDENADLIFSNAMTEHDDETVSVTIVAGMR